MCIAFDPDFAAKIAEELTKAYGPDWPNWGHEQEHSSNDSKSTKEINHTWGMGRFEALVIDVSKFDEYRTVMDLGPDQLVIFAAPKCNCKTKFKVELDATYTGKIPTLGPVDFNNDNMPFLRDAIAKMPADLKVLHMYAAGSPSLDKQVGEQVVHIAKSKSEESDEMVEVGTMSFFVDESGY